MTNTATATNEAGTLALSDEVLFNEIAAYIAQESEFAVSNTTDFFKGRDAANGMDGHTVAFVLECTRKAHKAAVLLNRIMNDDDDFTTAAEARVLFDKIKRS